MKSRIAVFVMPVLALCIGGGLLVAVLHSRNQQHIQATLPVPNVPQCAHWSIFRTAQLLGIPTESGVIQRLLPNEPQGHSLAQVVETLGKIGIKAEGFRDDWDSLAKLSFPCIVHLANPDHFIVVSGIEPQQEFVHIFDSDGNRTRQQRESFEKRWTGYTLHLMKDETFFAAKAGDSKPCATYEHLILDKGDIPAIGGETEFVYPIHNNGNSNLVVEDIKVSCGCLRSEKPTNPIPAGGSDVIKLFYSVEPKRGVFSQTAAVRTNDTEHPIVVLSACGFTGVDVRVEPSKIQLEKLFAERECVYHCFVRYTGEWSDFQIELDSNEVEGIKLLRHTCVTFDKANLLDIALSSAANANVSSEIARNNRVLELVFETTGKVGENVSGTIVLKTNVAGYEKFTMKVSGTINPYIQAFPSVVDLSDGTEKTITLVTRTDEPFRIVDVQSNNTHYKFDAKQFLKEHQLTFKKGGTDSASAVVKYQLQNTSTSLDIPITLLNNAN